MNCEYFLLNMWRLLKRVYGFICSQIMTYNCIYVRECQRCVYLQEQNIASHVRKTRLIVYAFLNKIWDKNGQCVFVIL